MAATALNDAEIIEALAGLDGWEREGNKLTKTYEFDQYLAGIAFAATAGTIAEGFDHHPDMFVGYKKVTLEFTTHSADSKITQKDIQVAQALDALPYPKK
ncbi:4a-hydroxytetrahydrobiopterin dehydratase [Phototrophicus methaneseepsis]|uniref:4a-hydroxytetrahydrobiopterin dehydratase n=1 Tax=Phototrophicus methaneseepsis TaxID=2710758 RepID=A0A7S8IEM5_9CHLR|nr:4a-hydroxytetrahydrobiopterin dehydratase [Phototrophicus methaneseepsis]QPC82604.1 4a-hydroxytetrahydrobiopterin dehydratase [Phototrophicus methaneseepsis]